ncbi:MAG: flagellar hook-basal body complex protein FliE [Alphaproteobacteria bacterium]
MDTKALSAAQAYASALTGKSTPGTDAAGAGAAAGPSFADLIKDVVEQTVEAGEKSEQTAVKAAAGQAELVDVITAVNAAEMTLETVMAVRDQVIQAYQDIVRMPI